MKTRINLSIIGIVLAIGIVSHPHWLSQTIGILLGAISILSMLLPPSNQ